MTTINQAACFASIDSSHSGAVNSEFESELTGGGVPIREGIVGAVDDTVVVNGLVLVTPGTVTSSDGAAVVSAVVI